MKSTLLLSVAVLCLVGARPAGAGVPSGSGEALLVSPSLDPWSVGAYYQLSAREVTSESGADLELRSRAYAVVLGLDLLPWLTLYGGAGGADARLVEISDYGRDRLAWSAGLALTMWKWAGYTRRPSWRLALKTQAEMAGYQSQEGGLEIRWKQYDVMFPLSYEVIFARQPQSFSDIHHLELYGGPALSFVDGRTEQGDQRTDFDEARRFGVAGGANLFILENLYIGCQVQYFDEVAVRGGIGYSFQ